ncbi:MAG TPA: chromosomal replication initiator protein DnaA [Patescibacteria group bacterium]|nr:chromosomal replication initiator protein DnaA [Patescibacteria group bacterium]
MTETEATWKKALTVIEPSVSGANFLAFFKHAARLESLDENGIAIIATTSAIAENMLKRHAEVIQTALEKQTGKKVTLSFTTKTYPNHKKEKPIPLFQEEAPKRPEIGHLPRVRADYTFATLAVSDSNRLAFVSAQNVAKTPGSSYNPLFIYGPVGVGKTHLMQAVANEVYQKMPDAKIVYITSEEFTNEVVEAIRSNDTARMKKRFRSAHLLIIDDVQFIAGKDKVQEELFHTFNSLIDSGGQIVLSSDRPPSEIQKLEARLSSRFAGGLTVDIEPPDFAMRTAIVLKKAEKFGYNIGIDVAKLIAEKEQDVRSLEGMLIRFATEAKTKEQELSTSLVEKVLGSRQKEKPLLHAEDVIQKTCEFYTIKPTQLKGPKRDASLVKARQITMYLLKNELGLTYNDIGNLLGGRDHTTIMYGVGRMEQYVVEKSFIYEEIMGIIKLLRG